MGSQELESRQTAEKIKYFFVINPNAGRRREQKRLHANIVKACEAAGADFEIYDTECAGDGGEYMISAVNALLEGENADPGLSLRFYFGGGDGTVLESANAYMALPEELRRSGRVAVGILPVGTGNDFLRNFGTAKDFLNIDRQLAAEARDVDLIAYGGKYCANMFNIGFDCQVVVRVNHNHGKAFMTKNLAYPLGVVHTLRKFPHTYLRVSFDNGEEFKGKFLLTLVSNGSYCGGGFYAASKARPDDGLLDVLMVDPITRRQFISMVGKYKKGKLLGTKLGDSISTLRKCRSVTIESPEETDICVDGEVERFTKVTMTNVPAAFRFLVP
ncbi:MAG: hypothetical protein J5584_00555 [Clostridia bacterium]|nr:hypothetical protein [Clostridia bacterium]